MIEIKNLSKSLSNRVILDEISLKFEDKKIYVILGPSGSGKSVLLKNIIGLMTPDGGEVIIDEQNILGLREKELDKIRKNCGFLFQHSALFDSMTIEENLAFPLFQHSDLNNEEILKKVNEKLELVGLSGVNKKMPSELSGGMQKRAALARSIILEPKYIFYDEPTTGLDPIMSRNIDDLIKDLNKKLGITSIVVTHDMITAFDVADRMCLLYDGKVRVEGSIDELKNSENPYLKQFISGERIGPIIL